MSLISSMKEKLKKVKLQKISERSLKEITWDHLAMVIDKKTGKDIVALKWIEDIHLDDKGECYVRFDPNFVSLPLEKEIYLTIEEKLKKIPRIDKVTLEIRDDSKPMETKKNPKENQSKIPNIETKNLSQVKNTIAIASGKGGVGKSTVSFNLAVSLKNSGFKVGILDADIYGPSISHLFDNPKPNGMEDNNVRPSVVDGIKIVSMAMFSEAKKAAILRGPMAAQVIKQFLTQVLWGELDYLIIDYPPGTGDIQLTVSQTIGLTGAVLVTSPAEISVIDVRKAIGMFQVLKVPVLGIAETMSYFQCNGCDKKYYLFGKEGGRNLAREYALSLLAEIPFTEENLLKLNSTEKTTDNNEVVKSYQNLSKKLVDKVKIITQK